MPGLRAVASSFLMVACTAVPNRAAEEPGQPATPRPAEATADEDDVSEESPPPLRLRLREASDANGSWLLAFEVSNRSEQAVRYIGYTADSYNPPLEKPTIAPLYRIEFKSGDEWKEPPVGWCGTGVGDVSLEPGEKATFIAHVPAGDWKAARVGIAYEGEPNAEGRWPIAWSKPLTPERLAEWKQPDDAPATPESP